MEKRYCVLSGSRTGSTMLQVMLWRYVNRKLGYHTALGDFMLRNWPYDTGWSIATTRLSHLTPHEAWHMEINRQFEYNRRVDLIRKYHDQKYFIKFPSYFWLHCDEEHLQYLYNNYHFVITDRKNKRERALSYAICIISNWFTIRRDGQEKNFKPGEFTEEIGEMILYDFRALDEAKKQIMNTPGIAYSHLWYEDMVAHEDRYEVLGDLGFPDWQEYVTPRDRERLPRKVGDYIDKNAHITNIEYFDEWLQEYFPEDPS